MGKPIYLKEYVEMEEDEKVKAALNRQIRRASSFTGESFDRVKVRSVSEMGEAAGRYKPETKETEVRLDIVSTQEGIHNELCHVLVHEAVHGEGCYFEGITERIASKKTGHAPVSAYASKVEAARQLEYVIGETALEKLSTQQNAGVLLMQAYVEGKIKGALGEKNEAETIEKAVEDGRELLKKVA